MGTVATLIPFPLSTELHASDFGFCGTLTFRKTLGHVRDAVAILRHIAGRHPVPRAIDWQRPSVTITDGDDRNVTYQVLIPWRDVEAPRHGLEENERRMMQ